VSTSENGWQTVESSSRLLHTWVIPLKGGHTVSIRMRRGSVGFLLAYAIMLWDARIEPVWQKLLDDWGWAARPVRGQTTLLSNHYSGTAVDINATRHNLGSVGTVLRAALWRTLMAARFRGLLRWGGDYHNRKDEMHVELAPGTTMAQVEGRARTLANTKRGKLLLDHNRGQRKVIFS
jgi:hypothetical protein